MSSTSELPQVHCSFWHAAARSVYSALRRVYQIKTGQRTWPSCEKAQNDVKDVHFTESHLTNIEHCQLTNLLSGTALLSVSYLLQTKLYYTLLADICTFSGHQHLKNKTSLRFGKCSWKYELPHVQQYQTTFGLTSRGSSLDTIQNSGKLTLLLGTCSFYWSSLVY